MSCNNSNPLFRNLRRRGVCITRWTRYNGFSCIPCRIVMILMMTLMKLSCNFSTCSTTSTSRKRSRTRTTTSLLCTGCTLSLGWITLLTSNGLLSVTASSSGLTLLAIRVPPQSTWTLLKYSCAKSSRLSSGACVRMVLIPSRLSFLHSTRQLSTSILNNSLTTWRDGLNLKELIAHLCVKLETLPLLRLGEWPSPRLPLLPRTRNTAPLTLLTLLLCVTTASAYKVRLQPARLRLSG